MLSFQGLICLPTRRKSPHPVHALKHSSRRKYIYISICKFIMVSIFPSWVERRVFTPELNSRLSNLPNYDPLGIFRFCRGRISQPVSGLKCCPWTRSSPKLGSSIRSLCWNCPQHPQNLERVTHDRFRRIVKHVRSSNPKCSRSLDRDPRCPTFGPDHTRRWPQAAVGVPSGCSDLSTRIGGLQNHRQ